MTLCTCSQGQLIDLSNFAGKRVTRRWRVLAVKDDFRRGYTYEPSRPLVTSLGHSKGGAYTCGRVQGSLTAPRAIVHFPLRAL